MSRCAWCNEEVIVTLSIKELITFRFEERPLCVSCSKQLIRLDGGGRCRGCSRTQASNALCQDCLAWRHQYPIIDLRHQAVYAYTGIAKEIVTHFKFKGDCELAAVFSNEMRQLTKKTKNPSLIVPIPISTRSLKERGFNQTEVILDAAGIAYSSLLENSYEGEKQSKKSRSERLKSPQPFSMKYRAEGKVKSKHLVLVDDVYTTGRTLYHAASILYPYEPASIRSISLFR